MTDDDKIAMLTREQKIKIAARAGLPARCNVPASGERGEWHLVAPYSAEILAALDAAYAAGVREGRERAAKVCEDAGLEDVSLRDMRPKSASDEQQGAQDRLGHMSGTTTRRVYRRLATKAKPTK